MKQNLFEEIFKDNFSGSGNILSKVQKELLSLQQEEKFETNIFFKQLDKLENHFPQFALLFHFLNALRNFLEKEEVTDAQHLTGFIRQYQSQWENTQQKASENLLNTLPLTDKNILLHSNSSAIHNLFQEMAVRNIFPTVWQTVSSPANEGLKQAEILKNRGFQVHVLHEDVISKFIDHIDLAIFGADLLWDKAFLNKTGTLPLSLVFQHFHKPVYILAESRKHPDKTKIKKERFLQFLHEQPKPAGEIYPQPAAGITVHNYYFETIPLSLVTRVFLEK